MKRGLGKGLDSIIPRETSAAKKGAPQAEPEADGSKKIVKITRVEPNRKQPRKHFDEDALQELADSIKKVGIIEPILVRENKDYYEIIAGERRWRASKLAGLKEVPIIIRNDLTEQQIVEIQLIENLQRENLNPIEEAQGYKRLIEEFELKQDEVAERVSKSRVAITNSLRLLKLCEPVQQMIIDKKLSTGHARAIISIENPEQQTELAEKIFDERLSVRDAEKLVRQILEPAKQKKKEQKKNENLESIYRDLETKCTEAVGTRVVISSKGDGAGKIEIDFYNSDDLEKITDRIRRAIG